MTATLIRQMIRQALRRVATVDPCGRGLTASEIHAATGLSRERILRELAAMPDVQAVPGTTRAAAPDWHREAVWTVVEAGQIGGAA